MKRKWTQKQRQPVPPEQKFTIKDFNDRYPDDASCLAYIMEQRFPGGMAFCDKCEQERKHHRLADRPAYSCDYCGKMISPMAGTIFDKSSTSLRLWFYAMYQIGR